MADHPHSHDPRFAHNGQAPLDRPGEAEDLHSPLDPQVLVTLLLDYPSIQRALKRDPETDEERHQLYDILLADAGVKSGWSVEQIVALIRDGNRRSARPEPSAAYCELMIQESRLRTNTGDLDFARERLLDTISDTWGIALAAVIKHGDENTLWHLRLVDGREIGLGTTKDLFAQATVRQRIFERTNHMIPRYQPRDIHLWEHHLHLLGLVAQMVDTPEMTRAGQARTMVRAYLEAHFCDPDRDTSTEEWEILAHGSRPFVREGAVYLSVKHLWPYVRLFNPRLTQPDILDLLRLLHGRRLTITIERPKHTTRSVWRLVAKDLQEETSGGDPITPSRSLPLQEEITP